MLTSLIGRSIVLIVLSLIQSPIDGTKGASNHTVSRKDKLATTTTQKNPSPVLSTKDSLTSMGNSDLDRKKLQLEIDKLNYEVHGKRLLDWALPIGTAITSLGILGTLWLGISQQRQGRLSRDDERFERSITRLGSQQPSERLTGLAGIQQFLKDPEPARQESTLRFLVNATVVEKDPTVRSALIDVFESLKEMKLSNQALNQGLIAARDRNRALLKSLADAFSATQNEAKKRLVDSSYTEVPIGNPPPEQSGPLDASAKTIAALIRAGGRVDDLSSVYCVDCEFSSYAKPTDLRGTSFNGAFLRRADFSAAQLDSASFHNADLILTKFTGASLKNAKISADEQLEPWSVSAALYSGELAASWGANFSCSDLSYADFAGRAIFTLMYQNPTYGGGMHDEFYGANLNGAKFGATRFIIGVPESLLPLGTTSSITSKVLPEELSPVTGFGPSPLSDPVPYFGGPKYMLWVTALGAQNQEFKPLPNPYRRDLVITFSSITASKNFEQADIPPAVRTFILANREAFSKPLTK